jgi:signal transduction histidine kinase
MEGMLVAEVERLQRLVAPSASAEPDDLVDLDALVGSVVLARRLAGQEIAWTPSGGHVAGRSDDLTEVLNILAVNAWRHAQGAPARIDVTHDDGAVHICVSDDGPGVPSELRESIFERGVRRRGSSGQGLGLPMARALMEQLGGTLSLVPTAAGGACFTASLPASGRNVA